MRRNYTQMKISCSLRPWNVFVIWPLKTTSRAANCRIAMCWTRWWRRGSPRRWTSGRSRTKPRHGSSPPKHSRRPLVGPVPKALLHIFRAEAQARGKQIPTSLREILKLLSEELVDVGFLAECFIEAAPSRPSGTEEGVGWLSLLVDLIGQNPALVCPGAAAATTSLMDAFPRSLPIQSQGVAALTALAVPWVEIQVEIQVDIWIIYRDIWYYMILYDDIQWYIRDELGWILVNKTVGRISCLFSKRVTVLIMSSLCHWDYFSLLFLWCPYLYLSRALFEDDTCLLNINKSPLCSLCSLHALRNVCFLIFSRLTGFAWWTQSGGWREGCEERGVCPWQHRSWGAAAIYYDWLNWLLRILNSYCKISFFYTYIIIYNTKTHTCKT